MHEMYDRHLKTMTAEVANESDLDGINAVARRCITSRFTIKQPSAISDNRMKPIE